MVVVASQYPLVDAFWTMIVFFGWILWIWFLFTVFGDLFSRHDIGGWGKAAWTVFVLLVPILGSLIYLITQGRSMTERRMQQASAAQASFDDHVRAVAASSDRGNGVSQISKAKQLLDSGAISPAEFETIKTKALAS
ncbi:MAG: SHOCT domain-containing protein [Frankiaceae bacterium]